MKLALALTLLPFAANAAVCGFSYCPDSVSTGSGGAAGGSVTGANQYRTAGGLLAGDNLIIDDGAGSLSIGGNLTVSGTAVSNTFGTVAIGTTSANSSGTLHVNNTAGAFNIMTLSRTGNPNRWEFLRVSNQWIMKDSSNSNTNMLQMYAPSSAESRVGVNMPASAMPNAQLDVYGTVSASGVKLGSSNACSSASDVGTIYDAPNRRSTARCRSVGVLDLYTTPSTPISASAL